MYSKSGRRKKQLCHLFLTFIQCREKGFKLQNTFSQENLNEMSYFQEIKSKILQIVTPMNM